MECNAASSSGANQPLPSSATPYSDATQTKKHKPGHVKRPMNAFMVFSQKARKEIIRANPGQHNAPISKQLGAAWRKLSEEEKQPYREEAKRLRDLHSAEYPNYKYRPKKKAKSATNSGSTAKSASTSLPGSDKRPQMSPLTAGAGTTIKQPLTTAASRNRSTSRSKATGNLGKTNTKVEQEPKKVQGQPKQLGQQPQTLGYPIQNPHQVAMNVQASTAPSTSAMFQDNVTGLPNEVLDKGKHFAGKGQTTMFNNMPNSSSAPFTLEGTAGTIVASLPRPPLQVLQKAQLAETLPPPILIPQQPIPSQTPLRVVLPNSVGNLLLLAQPLLMSPASSVGSGPSSENDDIAYKRIDQHVKNIMPQTRMMVQPVIKQPSTAKLDWPETPSPAQTPSPPPMAIGNAQGTANLCPLVQYKCQQDLQAEQGMSEDQNLPAQQEVTEDQNLNLAAQQEVPENRDLPQVYPTDAEEETFCLLDNIDAEYFMDTTNLTSEESSYGASQPSASSPTPSTSSGTSHFGFNLGETRMSDLIIGDKPPEMLFEE